VDWLDCVILVLYLVAMFCVAMHFRRRQKDTTRYFTAGGSLPAWAVGISLMSTIIGSVTFLAYPGQGYSGTWILLVQGLMVPIVVLIILWFIVPCYRRFIRISTYEYFERRFGYAARLYSSLAFLVAALSKMAFGVYLTATGINFIFHLNPFYVLGLVGLVATAATLVGGIEAVIWTEVIQGLVLICGGLLCASVLLFRPTGNPADVIHLAAQANKMTLGPFALSFTQVTFWVMSANGLCYALQKYGTDQTVVQRFLAARSDRDAIKASILGALLCVPVWTLFMFIGTCLWAFYQLTPARLAAGIKPDHVLPYFIATQLPAGAIGLVMAALLSATLATLQSDLNGISAIVVEDYYHRLRPRSSDRQRLLVGRCVVALAGATAVAIASLYAAFGEKNVLALIFNVYAIFSGGIAGLFLLGFATTRANRRGVNVGIIACILFTAWAFLTSNSITVGGVPRKLLDLGRYNYTQPDLMLGVYSHIVLFSVGYVASFFFGRDQNVRELTIVGWLWPAVAAR
jgi:SSS family solute:Na+ symporter